MNIGSIVIGRNEGDRLKQCLHSLSSVRPVVYVDSGSVDGSVQWARENNVEVVTLRPDLPFTAARARNTGFRRLQEIENDIHYVQFVDGDCTLAPGWIQRASAFLNEHPDVAIVSGRLRERFPDRSVYNWMCDREWVVPAGEVQACGGIAMVRAGVFADAGGFREDLIAGEEPELCVRLRAKGWRVWRIDDEMAAHDAAMTRFAQWWWRSVRTGYGFAQGAALHGGTPARHYLWESRRAWLWGIWLPFACLAAGLVFGPWGWMSWLIYPAQVLRQTVRNHGSLRERATLALFQVIGRFPESWGQLKFLLDRLRGRGTVLIEYK